MHIKRIVLFCVPLMLIQLAHRVSAEVPPGYEIVRLPIGDLSPSRPSINDDSLIVWSGFAQPATFAIVFALRDGVVESITDGSAVDGRPDVNDAGAMAWRRAADRFASHDIVFRDTDGLITVFDTTDALGSVVLNNAGQMVWTDNLGSNYQLFFFDGQAVQRLTDDQLSHHSARINDKGHIVWSAATREAEPTQWMIMLYRDGVIETLVEGINQVGSPDINNSGRVVWSDRERGIIAWENGETTIVIADGGGPRLNNRGDLTFSRSNDETGRHETWLMKDGEFFQLDVDDFRAGGSADINNAGEVVWRGIRMYTFEDALFYLRPFSCTGSLIPDCNANGIHDQCDVDDGTSLDCNGNGVPDECLDIEGDCNGNAVPDDCDIAGGFSVDDDENGVPDSCQSVVRVPAEYPTIQAGIDAAEAGDTVLVADGTYEGPANRNLDFGGKNLTVRSENGPTACVLDCRRIDSAFNLRSGESRASRIEGFTILAAGNERSGFSCFNSSPIIRRCIFTECVAGAFRVTAGSEPVIENCLIAGNVSGTSRPGITVLDRSRVLVRNCTIAGNNAGISGQGFVVASDRSEVTLHQSILFGNITGRGKQMFVERDSIIRVSYSNIEDGFDGILAAGPDMIVWGPGNLDIDPLFVDPVLGDYQLRPESRAIDAGDPNFVPAPGESDLDGNPRLSLGAVDMGAQESSTAADCNGNDSLDWRDIEAGKSLDCNANGLPDECDLDSGTSGDCNVNAIPDECDAAVPLSVSSEQLSPIGFGSPQSFVIESLPRAVADVTLSFTASGDLGSTSKQLHVTLNGTRLGEIFRGGKQCPFTPDRDELVVSSERFNAAICGANAVIRITATDGVDPIGCGDSTYVLVSVDYFQSGAEDDCNNNRVPDTCDLFDETSEDENQDGIPDECVPIGERGVPSVDHQRMRAEIAEATIFSGYIDPRKETSNGVILDLGIRRMRIVFSTTVFDVGSTQGGVTAGILTPDAFSVTETGPLEPPTVVGIDIDPDDDRIVHLDLDRPISPKEWTTVRVRAEDGCGNVVADLGDLGPDVDEPDRIDVGFLPGDINNSGNVSPLDRVLALQFRRGICSSCSELILPSPLLRFDTDRSLHLSAIDSVRMQQLYFGTGASTQAWRGESMNHRRP